MNTHTGLRRCTRLAALVALLVGLFAPPVSTPVHAQGITVTTTLEAPGGSGDCTLGEAIQAANSGSAVDACAGGSGDDVITLAAGATYTLTIASGNQSAFQINHQVTVQGNNATLAHDPLGGPLRFFLVPNGSALTLIDLTLAGGLAQGANGMDGPSNGVNGTSGMPANGGAIYSLGGQIVLDGVCFVHNQALAGRGGNGFAGATMAIGAGGGTAGGGAIASAGLVTIHAGGAYFSDNQAVGGRGGNAGLLTWPGGAGGDALGGALLASHLDTTNGPLTIEDNLSQGGDGGSGTPSGYGGQGSGGGLYVGTGNVTGALLTSNRAQGGSIGTTLSFDSNLRGGAAKGGGIYAVDAQLTGSRLVNNLAQGGDGLSGGLAWGGGLYYDDFLPADLRADVILTNTALGGQGTDASGAGGAAFGGGVNIRVAQLTMVASALVGNTAQGGADSAAASVTDGSGGGLALYTYAMVTNTTLALNHASVGGGLAQDGTDNVSLTHVTVVSNTASTGGGLNGLAITLRNSVVAYNTPANCAGAVLGVGSNLQYPGSACGGATVNDPRVLPVGDYGGNTLTAALARNSPAIDAGLLADCPATDQRGTVRPLGAGCDLGAYERWADLFLPIVRR